MRWSTAYVAAALLLCCGFGLQLADSYDRGHPANHTRQLQQAEQAVDTKIFGSEPSAYDVLEGVITLRSTLLISAI